MKYKVSQRPRQFRDVYGGFILSLVGVYNELQHFDFLTLGLCGTKTQIRHCMDYSDSCNDELHHRNN